jgi:aminoglycoside phosphotransferase (APT) family kinase protein
VSDTIPDGERNPHWVDWEPLEPIDSQPPSSTLDWIEDELEGTVIEVLALPGGLSSAIHRIELLDGRAVVLRRYVLADWLQREPGIPGDEVRILQLLPELGLGTGTPNLILADPEASRNDVPALVMSAVPGRPDIAPADTGPWADALAACLADIHAVPAAAVSSELQPFRRWDEPDRPIPTWAGDKDMWREAREQVPDELPVGDPCFLHRDYHPCNIHWSAGKIVGVVDWLGGCVGDAAADLAHCRWNLAVLTEPAVALRFTDHYRELTGYDGDTVPYDLSTVLSAPVGPFPTFAWNALGRRDLDGRKVAERIDTWLANILANEGRG